MNPVEQIHAAYAGSRRMRVLAGHIAPLLPENARTLDVGCGDGQLDRALISLRPDIELRGIDVLPRPGCAIPVEPFDGRTIPHGDASFDAVCVVDVLHHADDPEALLAEVVRVSRRAIVIKDHTLSGWLAEPTLRFMDRVGNARYGVALPYHYWPLERWQRSIDGLGLETKLWKQDLHLYPAPADWVFGRSLHFIALLERRGPPTERARTQ